YNPGLPVGRHPRRELAPLLNEKAAERANFPAIDRALSGTYPPGSTFKPVTALAALEEHLVSPYDSLWCTGRITIAKQVFKNWDPYTAAPLTMPVALARSCDTYFYQLGYRFWKLPPDRKQPLQDWARRFGFGRPTGVDLGPEASGLLPTIAWRHATFTKKTDRCCWQVDRLWKPGNSVPLAIAGKTGTAEKHVELPGFSGMMDQSWWCGYGPADNPTIVVCSLIENGGHGGDAAAPAALKVFEQYFGVRAPTQGQVYSD